jgi:hypothetical protein
MVLTNGHIRHGGGRTIGTFGLVILSVKKQQKIQSEMRCWGGELCMDSKDEGTAREFGSGGVLS